MATFILLSELLVTAGWFNFTTCPRLKRMLVLPYSPLSMPHLKVYESKVSFCGWPDLRYICYWTEFPALTIVQSPLQSPMWKSYLWTIWRPAVRRKVATSSWWLLSIVNLVRLGKVGIMLLRKWQVYVKQISRYRFHRSNSDLIINRHRGHRAI